MTGFKKYYKDSEFLVPFLGLVLGILMFVGAGSFTGLSRIWPQVISGVLSVGAFIVLIKYFIIRTNINLDLVNKLSSGDQYSDDSEKSKNAPHGERMMNNFQFMTLTLILFLAGIFLIGFLWSSPLYVAIYLLWHDHDLPIVVGEAGLIFIVSYVFNLILGVDLSTGLAWGVLI